MVTVRASQVFQRMLLRGLGGARVAGAFAGNGGGLQPLAFDEEGPFWWLEWVLNRIGGFFGGFFGESECRVGQPRIYDDRLRDGTVADLDAAYEDAPFTRLATLWEAEYQNHFRITRPGPWSATWKEKLQFVGGGKPVPVMSVWHMIFVEIPVNDPELCDGIMVENARQRYTGRLVGLPTARDPVNEENYLAGKGDYRDYVQPTEVEDKRMGNYILSRTKSSSAGGHIFQVGTRRNDSDFPFAFILGDAPGLRVVTPLMTAFDQRIIQQIKVWDKETRDVKLRMDLDIKQRFRKLPGMLPNWQSTLGQLKGAAPLNERMPTIGTHPSDPDVITDPLPKPPAPTPWFDW